MRQNLLKNLLSIALFVFSTGWVMSQGVTTASIQGTVSDSSGETLPGANIVATHEPSGTRYGAVSNLEGRFVLPNMRVGGPYTVRVSFVGFEERVFDSIVLGLGQNYTINVTLSDGLELEAVEVVASKDAIMNADKTGAALNLNNQTINKLPTVNRNINDFTRLTPQSNGTSFAGTSSRFNNYTIDGNIYNNNFGLGSGQFAGSNPISLDAIEEVQVNLAPYDVRQAGFTGASVNAITKSGTNEFSGSAYYYLRNDQMIGDKVGDTRLNKGDSKNEIAGFRLGGPIIKNKLFFFVSYEKETEAVPSFTKVASRPGLEPDGLTVSRVPASQLDYVRQQMMSIYGYETGPYENYPFASEQERFNARLDFNLNENHKVSLRYNNYTAFTDVPTNGNSVRYISTRYRNTSRTGIEAMNFRNANYTNDRKVQSWVAEVNSRVGANMSNQVNIGYTSITDPKRGIPGGQAFPFIEVMEPDASGNLLYYFSLGNELYTVGNLLENNIFNFTDNFSIYKGKHTYTLGVNFEYMTFKNAFNPVFNGFYRFNSYDDFVSTVIDQNTGAYPEAFAKGYALDGSTTPPVDQTKFGQIGFYIQDEYQITQKMKVTGGLRVDFPFYPIDIPSNELLDDLNKTFESSNGTITPDVSQFPKVNPLWSPRVGFNWDAKGDRTTQVRGGTGIFSGRIPFVWLSNQVNGSGVVRGGLGYEGDDVVEALGPNYVFNPDVTYGNPENPGQSLSNELNLTDKDFKLPQVWRSNVAVDQVLPFGIIGTLEFIYSKDVSTPIAENLVLRSPDGNLSGPDTRPYWEGSNYSDDSDFRNVFYLTNAKEKADYYSLTAQLQKQFESGFSAMVAYTRSRSRDLDAANGSQAISLWPSTVVSDRNNPQLSYAGFDIPNRVIGSISYETKTSTVTLFYEGADAGRFSYTYSGNFGDASNRLMYIPNNASELEFEEFTLNGATVTAAEQASVLDAYIDQDKYLSDNRGSVAERNGAVRPWVNRFDLRFTQDILFTSDDKNKLQLSIDILNIGNMFNSDWGVPKFAYQSTLLNYRGNNDSGEPVYRLNTVSGTSEFPTETFRTSTSLSDTWRMQVGIRYIFN
ncbi:TonB-dependent receptor [Algoriphagus zhangzhouensis]|uniref:Carboxypeptidase regulatory-like domain-containing protein n=1 Tax=Algoriphagus zhangzhouensis TaxID=1073327 RepID=A0A1M7ZL63_9BACT|nr:carboxypeptidase regulatory-like domain-containing protein [Algoriphagus zhangzhouensis]TDY42635.1 carboxypeptidase family protein [Algoriphagus zhangzhouensis]SHO65416.1 Carboxypeptidase regulatory-like domain-containing protein [Algoriphagus zhangzhouensis]